MKRILIAIFAFAMLMFSCDGGKMTGSRNDASADLPDSVDSAVTDTMELIITETAMPKAADELFDDFFFNFAANKKLQMERIVFPLPIVKSGRTDSVGKSKWKTEHFFMRQGYYTLIFDNARQMESGKDTTINHVVVEKIYLNIKTVKQYIFDRIDGLWMMRGINIIPMYKDNNASFLKFYQSFVSDSLFQISSLNDPVAFVGPDPDDDFAQMEGLLTPETWPAFAPELPSKILYNINYGQANRNSNSKIFVMRGISNGLEIELVFKRKNGKWLLTKMTT